LDKPILVKGMGIMHVATPRSVPAVAAEEEHALWGYYRSCRTHASVSRHGCMIGDGLAAFLNMQSIPLSPFLPTLQMIIVNSCDILQTTRPDKRRSIRSSN